jgi:hypothetical protein
MRSPALLALVLCACFDGKPDDSQIPDSSDTGDTGAPETCLETWYADADGDGFGDTDASVEACTAPSGHSAVDGDCDDADAQVHPEASEACNGVDDDCDGEIDEDVATTWYQDEDGDGWGSDHAIQACDPPSGYVAVVGDCDDQDALVNPDASEICDEVDNDCDGEIDEDVGETWYADADFDGYGDPHHSEQACEQPSGTVDNAEDCDDGSAGVHPGATDICNATDDDCDGSVDEDVKAGWTLVSIDTRAGDIVEIDPATAAVSVITDITDTSVTINSMDVREDGTPIVHNSADYELMSIDVCSGDTTSIGSTGTSDMGGIGFGSSGQLYGLDTANDRLVQLSTTTGLATPVGPLGFDIGANGLAYDCSTDTLWGADSASGNIFGVDLATGAATGFVSTSVPFGSVGLEFDHGSGMLLAATGYALYEVDPATGATTFIGDLDTDLTDDLAFYPPCP